MTTLRDVNELLGPAVERVVAALSPPDADSALVALARRQARVIDAMPDEVAIGILPNHAGPLVKVLAELEDRARRRNASHAGRPGKVAQLRAAHAQATSKRTAG